MPGEAGVDFEKRTSTFQQGLEEGMAFKHNHRYVSMELYVPSARDKGSESFWQIGTGFTNF